MHPSVIKPKHLRQALNSVVVKLSTKQLPLEVTLDNIPIFEKLIKISCYTVDRQITYILQIPIVHTFQFDYYHLYSIPTFHKGLFKVVIPSGKYLVQNELYFAFAGDACTETVAKQYVCKELDLRRIKESNPCEVQLLEQKTPTTCQEIEAVITEPVMKKLHDFGQWILLIPNETTITLSCQEDQETVKVLGSYLAEIPVGCTLELNQEPISIESQPIIF
ncbi:unnamed protein product [Acanthoscelides obtectus]|uniref:Uncharacterized protein n=1 Tax=Acanthoscelides obtectus TaxID=200917 RepID=A0A9P0PKE4_ACAOB|nr:unnamed protein product [Acanthoscelides obtectus]CAK1638312.1 hypothetical protein AOBTE_LOCUS10525 [Acanthoscelides obtectus]